jgi:Tfp pilus assembly protein PilV
MLEVVLALAVIAFGVVSVLALLPASMKASRDSVADTHSAQVGEHLVGVLSVPMEQARTTSIWASTALVLPTAKPGPAEPTGGWTRWLSQAGTTLWRAGTDQEFVRAEMRRDDAPAAEFSAVCRVWRQPVTVCELVSGTWQTRTLPWTEAVALNVEVSWPAQAPYAGRNKALYTVNVFRKAG